MFYAILILWEVLELDKKKKVAIGYENFKELIDKNLYYVDKTMFIYDLIQNNSKVSLITRPRRFGKTLNFSMLKYFFSITEKENAYIFDGLKISEHYDELKDFRNAYPVISLSMKGGKQPDFDNALDSLCNEIRNKFIDYSYILKGDILEPELKEKFHAIYTCRTTSVTVFKESIKVLSECLERYYGKKTVILIDEYDVPLENSYFCGFYDKMIGFIRSLFESALKTNDALEFAVITGCLRVSKESIFTGLNNLKVNSILVNNYAEYFGFEECEVKELLDYYDLGEYFDITKSWYDGYTFGDKDVYNPWSVVNYASRLLTESDKFPYNEWVNSSSNSIIRKLVNEADETTKSDVERLIIGGSVRARLDETVTYADLDAKIENMWNFLFFTGYLKNVKVEIVNDKRWYDLVIPNKEIKQCYEDIIITYFEKQKKTVDRNELFNALLERDTNKFGRIITDLLKRSISFYDGNESFYHGLISGMLANSYYYRLESNRESGDGRYDIALYQEDELETAIIIEIKLCDKKEGLKDCCKRALKQIDDKHYSAEAESLGYTNIIKYGIAFKNKLCGAMCE